MPLNIYYTGKNNSDRDLSSKDGSSLSEMVARRNVSRLGRRVIFDDEENGNDENFRGDNYSDHLGKQEIGQQIEGRQELRHFESSASYHNQVLDGKVCSSLHI